MCLTLPAQDKKTSEHFAFSTSAPADITPPIISDVFTSGFDLHTKTIVWKTNEASDSQVEYGTTTSCGSATALDPSMVTSHSQLLTGLAAGGTYHYRVLSRDAAGNLASSDDMTFWTTEGEPPVICAVSISGITSTTAIIAWTTNEASDSQVQYGIAMSYGSSNTVDSTLVTSHAQMLVSLTANTKYDFRVISRDVEGNFADVGIVPFQLLGKAPDYMEALNGQSASAGASTLHCPQYVVGGPYLSTLSITNLNRFAGTLTLRFYLDNGTQIGPARTLPIAAHGKVYISDQSFFVSPEGGMLQGYVEIATDGVRVVGSVVFTDPMRSSFATALPLVAQLQRTMVFSQVASDPTNFTGLAILNPNDATAVARLELFREDRPNGGFVCPAIPFRV